MPEQARSRHSGPYGNAAIWASAILIVIVAGPLSFLFLQDTPNPVMVMVALRSVSCVLATLIVVLSIIAFARREEMESPFISIGVTAVMLPIAFIIRY